MTGRRQLSTLVLLTCLGLCTHSALANVSGTVFRDLPLNQSTLNTYGVLDSNEHGLAGISVTVTGDNGVTQTVQSDTSGKWASTIGALGTKVRIEFTNVPTYLFESTTATQQNSSVRFVDDGSTGVNFGVHNPADYFNSPTPPLVTNAYINGDPFNCTNPNDLTLACSYKTLLQFNYDASGNSYTTDPSNSAIAIANLGQIGATWGLAYQRTTDTLFTAAFVKRHVGLGSINGAARTTGGIYALDRTTHTLTPWLDINNFAGINTGTDPRTEEGSTLPAARAGQNYDVLAFSEVGKRGLGGMAISEDDKTLYVMNLYQRSLLAIDIKNKTLVSNTPVNNPDSNLCAPDDVRPFAVSVHDGAVYIGVVCSAETSQNTSQLHAYAMRLNGSSFQTIVDFPLTFARGYGFTGLNASALAPWRPWARNANDIIIASSYRTAYSPVFSGLTFDDDGSMVMGFFDRGGHQLGSYNYAPNINVGNETIAQGDIYRACPNASGQLVMESNGSCGSITTLGANNNQGINGGEYYVGDWGGVSTDLGSNFGHQNSGLGGVAILPGSGLVASTAMSPTSGDPRRSGIKWLSNSTGDHVRSYDLQNTTNSTADGFSKANGLGDLEVLGVPAPIEVGNRVWNDSNSNGLQDPDELGIGSVTVNLICGTDSVTTTTDSQGNYYFNSSTNASTLTPGKQCSISIDSAQIALKDLVLSPVDANTISTNDAKTDTLDSDATLINSLATINFTVGNAGENNHSFDIGFHTPDKIDLNLTKAVSNSSVQPGETFTYTLTLTNESTTTATNVNVKELLPSRLQYISDNSGGTYNPSTGIWQVGTVLAGSANAKILTLTVTAPISTVEPPPVP